MFFPFFERFRPPHLGSKFVKSATCNMIFFTAMWVSKFDADLESVEKVAKKLMGELFSLFSRH